MYFTHKIPRHIVFIFPKPKLESPEVRSIRYSIVGAQVAYVEFGIVTPCINKVFFLLLVSN